MTIKHKITLYSSLFFSGFYALIAFFIVLSFSLFRAEEFKERLNEKALTTIRLLLDVKEVDNDLLKIIDENSIHQLYEEKTLVFDEYFNLIYSSLDDTKINWKRDDLLFLKKHGNFFKKEGKNEIYGIGHLNKGKLFYAIISANDNYGKSKLRYLTTVIIISFIIFLLATWIFTYTLIKKQLNPLNDFHKEISLINDLHIERQLPSDENSQNEIDLLSKEFNLMMKRITEVYNLQKDFTAHVSHELRTPLLKLSVQIENQLLEKYNGENIFLKNMMKEICQLNDLINSLLLLTQNNQTNNQEYEPIRIDDVLYNAIEKITQEYKDISIEYSIEESVAESPEILEIKSSSNLLEITFSNLIKNAYLYSENKKVQVKILQENNRLMLCIINKGSIIAENAEDILFKPFRRGTNAVDSKGLGIGLTIVKRILANFGFSIIYHFSEGKHKFLIKF
ncbi:HAMP domain-containing sensor histidine kinase [Sediminibacterium sp.]|uniref:sensor histidine kinase n=1 Tax=Sediminibacterium sp. TaxID=1917865 RepID=UPI00272F2E23|nr:HAMP domain-containing sensor histidine kinase [Sediminibacterium sp.]MDP2421651.1 HAMP domain-containing sensor histidine kinase [Sediminibacterium sp.]